VRDRPEGSLDAAKHPEAGAQSRRDRCIGATTPAVYRKYIEKDRSLERRFQAIKLDPPGERETIEIILGVNGSVRNLPTTSSTPGRSH
jgi:ATP-dependent Clp protease ATP-binding subunit ClpC